MALNRQAIQQSLDMAAQQLENVGYSDLAARVDYYNNLVMNASEKEIPIIKRALNRIKVQCDTRNRLRGKQKPTGDQKAEHAVLNARRASLKRQLNKNRMLRELAAQKKKASDAVTPPEMEKKEDSALDKRIYDAELQLEAAQQRMNRLQRIKKHVS